jgi:hypothetical protein
VGRGGGGKVASSRLAVVDTADREARVQVRSTRISADLSTRISADSAGFHSLSWGQEVSTGAACVVVDTADREARGLKRHGR